MLGLVLSQTKMIVVYIFPDSIVVWGSGIYCARIVAHSLFVNKSSHKYAKKIQYAPYEMMNLFIYLLIDWFEPLIDRSSRYLHHWYFRFFFLAKVRHKLLGEICMSSPITIIIDAMIAAEILHPKGFSFFLFSIMMKNWFYL